MSIEEQKALKMEAWNEAMRYLDNARDTYSKAGKDGRLYTDRKYVRGGANYAYQGVLVALDAYLQVKGVPKPRRKSIAYYQANLGKLDKKLLARLNDAYDTLHLAGGYDGNLNVEVNAAGLKTAEEIINAIKP